MAELNGIIELLRHTQGDLILVTGSLYLVRGQRKGPCGATFEPTASAGASVSPRRSDTPDLPFESQIPPVHARGAGEVSSLGGPCP
eukprot:7299112-Pyramimonas_sp.AAC.1